MEREQLIQLVEYCRLSQQDLKASLTDELQVRRGKDRVTDQYGFIYSPGSHPVLLVAHLDTVHKTLPTDIYREGDYLYCAEGIGGDDRCGVFIIMELIKQLDCHVLFTEDEEIGGRGAIGFTQSGICPEVQYIVEFDRKGCTDAVYYECDNREFVQFIEQNGFIESYGSFSDISFIAPVLGVAAVNLSSGYQRAHTRDETINISDIDSIMKRAAKLISCVDTKYEYIERERMHGFQEYGRGEMYFDWSFGKCEFDKAVWDTDVLDTAGYGTGTCSECGQTVFEDYDYCPYCLSYVKQECFIDDFDVNEFDTVDFGTVDFDWRIDGCAGKIDVCSGTFRKDW